MSYLAALEPIVLDVIAPAATETDRAARFPRAALDRLGAAGLLGLVSAAEVGGLGHGLAEAARVVERIAQDCPSTAMVVTMHYAGAVLIEKYGPERVRREIAAGRHLTTLAWSETGSRSHFWAPSGTARRDGDDVVLDASKSMVTSAQHADSYVWSSRPLAGDEAATLWLVDSRLPGLQSPQPFDGLGLRGNASAPVLAHSVRLRADARLGGDGAGGAIMNGDELPVFCTLIASASIGLMDGALRRAIAHVTANRFSDSGGTLADLPTLRAYLARARIRADEARALRDDTLAALAAGRDDALLRVLEVKASAAEAALDVTETAMRVCGGSAFRKEAGIERLFRDARAAAVMAPTSDVLFDFIGRTLCGLPLA
ncbi:acyl-CoA dehydrogenase family protein [Paraburkholderia caballeronis]|uniref:Acyl-CoA dehydrogenase n=1 Tax=Paraburkholderia caballeronis TaxID=416943 RepID=A0A1H7FQF2_9BURK|nr:acyl-CoA dehydrogenase family protein [Paraburkholderia caballeronis]PXW24887.1 alkylation response protein AidB-like acyl-CoA dehydrogenase [Paraburkholderia caballeronis]PXX00617.1 alkylation response protein AidB-like acyl-CoA dehydrogenase [Paraburkholderia caballeronis]RAJ98680.1 alkylation response protein AidB-like acyl-CoA dehydrogenase [Paraburkholderia caballeronis]SEE69932.1 Acyl-CoA dehydrogenase [Paraburkholderia caballeronis]SEK28024.1 Acyl-CoA dehydrogenase [Paraburkholderia 